MRGRRSVAHRPLRGRPCARDLSDRILRAMPLAQQRPRRGGRGLREDGASLIHSREGGAVVALTLVIGNKNYSSWSLRPWIAMKVAGIAFDEVLISLEAEDFK